MAMRITAAANSSLLRVTQPFRLIGLTQTAVPRLLSAQTSPTTVTDGDAVVSRYTNETIVNDYDLEPVVLGSTEATIEWTSSNNLVATAGDRSATHVAPGSAIITASAGEGNAASIALTFAEQGGQTVDILQNYVAGSLAREAFDQVKARAAGKDVSTTASIYTSRDHATGVYVRNPNIWTGVLNLTGSAVYTETQQPELREATLIAPDIVHMVTHYEVAIGDKIRWATLGGTTVERTLVSKLSTKAHTGSDYDITLGLLDSPPEGITPYKVLPANFEDYLGAVSTVKPIPCIDMVRSEKVGISLVTALATGVWTDIRRPLESVITNPLTEYTHWDTFWNAKVSGDSGNAAFLIINNEAVFIGGYTYSWAVNNPSGTTLYPIMNAMMTALGSSYQLTAADLSSFTEFL